MKRLHPALFSLFMLAFLAGCASAPGERSTKSATSSSGGGGYYLNDGPGDNPPPDLMGIPDAVPRVETLRAANNRPYDAMGEHYVPITELGTYNQTGIASWYGRRYHGKPTASGEIYDMYAMTAAHPTLPIPSYARVTALDSGKSVIVRINDRGPFHSDRLIDLSYTAAYKLGVIGRGSIRVRVESLDPAKPMQLANTDSAPTGISATGYFVQLGVFGQADNAEKLFRQARSSLDIPAELVSMVSVGNLQRVRLGPFASDTEAAEWVARTHDILGIDAVKTRY